jgi:hypothetical protein
MTDFSERIRPGALFLVGFVVLIMNTLRCRDVIIICATKYTKFFVAVLLVFCRQMRVPYPGVVTGTVFYV